MPFAEVIGNKLPKKSPLPLVLLIAFILGVGVTYAESFSISAEEIIQLAQTAAAVEAEPGFMDNQVVSIILAGVRPIVPLVAFLFLVLKLVLREKLSGAGIVAYGLFLAVLGMIVFNVGLETGLAKLGDQSGGLVAGAFASVQEIPASPLYSVAVGIAIALAFAWALGFGATLAEPALNALGQTVENLTNGAFKKRTLMMAVALGVAFGISLGIVKIIFAVPIAYLVIPGYVLAIFLTFLSSEEFVNVAWDSAGVTTGPVTVPLVLAMGLGFGNSVDAIEGFGILSMASIGPIVSVLATGLFVQYSMRRQERAAKTDEISAGALAT